MAGPWFPERGSMARDAENEGMGMHWERLDRRDLFSLQ